MSIDKLKKQLLDAASTMEKNASDIQVEDTAREKVASANEEDATNEKIAMIKNRFNLDESEDDKAIEFSKLSEDALQHIEKMAMVEEVESMGDADDLIKVAQDEEDALDSFMNTVK